MRPFMWRRPVGQAVAAAAGAAAFVVLAAAGARACEPCGATLDLPRSLEKAELVVVAKRPAEPKQPENPAAGPPCDELLVERVLKGEFKGEKLRVRSWYGMCPYGIILSEGTYVVLLAGASSSDYEGHAVDPAGECKAALARREGFYVAVGQGCSVKALRVESGVVEAEGVKMTLEQFREKYRLRAAAESPRGLFGAWPGEYFGVRLFGPAAPLLEVTN